MCSTGEKCDRAICRRCLSEVKITDKNSFFSYNLNEILKENQRLRCAIQAGVINDYLDSRLTRTFKKLWTRFRKESVYAS